MIKKIMLLGLCACLLISAKAQDTRNTYCNPLNIDYSYMIFDSPENLSYRSGADPTVVEFRGEYYMFVTRSHGYWHSKDLLNWDFIKPQSWYFQGSNAPTAWNLQDSVLLVAGNPSGNGSILYTDDPKKGDWKGTASITHETQDAAIFIDDDGQTYWYWGSSNVLPIKGKKLDKEDRFLQIGESFDVLNLDIEAHGWERFGENHLHPEIENGFMEGPWVTKHNGKYYMQYGAPGTEFNVYGDGVYIGETPEGPWEYMPSNPMSYKPGGFMNGAGHGSTLLDQRGQYWHFASMALSANSRWERRLCMFPTYFDEDGLMYTNTHYGDYPRYAPTADNKMGEPTGWMLLSYNKPAIVSTSKVQQRLSSIDKVNYDPVYKEIKAEKNADGYYNASVLTDENAKTYWVAEENDDLQWVEIDLGSSSDIYAIQINYHDYKSNIYTRQEGYYHRYTMEVSNDKTNWTTIIDKSNSFTDVPNDYVQLENPVNARYVRYNHIHAPTPHFSLSDLRVFGVGSGSKPKVVKQFTVDRQEDRRDANLTWDEVKGAQGYNIRWGIAPDKLYNSWLVYEDTELIMRCFDRDQTYYVTIEAFNENGISKPTSVFKMD
ncbi:family 43 glycosylhydrolase [Aureibacter tunicatorum]|uniref:F5/8 type C domain-containing protein n=1 Tax=Aureibacter tunicatorum TaxID=866807 RepID=A0AAE3XT73_9BACT|nr:family 43 glycosylhydrolase [Aureibacter tunicatorum]MDR6241426.1 hypothetical protein [Aureibacter tunicatorum]BDD06729.1 endo-1,4-beta-xylanase [Aureibacter tunicatorum]